MIAHALSLDDSTCAIIVAGPALGVRIFGPPVWIWWDYSSWVGGQRRDWDTVNVSHRLLCWFIVGVVMFEVFFFSNDKRYLRIFFVFLCWGEGWGIIRAGGDHIFYYLSHLHGCIYIYIYMYGCYSLRIVRAATVGEEMISERRQRQQRRQSAFVVGGRRL